MAAGALPLLVALLGSDQPALQSGSNRQMLALIRTGLPLWTKVLCLCYLP